MISLRAMLFWFVLIMVGASVVIFIQVSSGYHQKELEEQKAPNQQKIPNQQPG